VTLGYLTVLCDHPFLVSLLLLFCYRYILLHFWLMRFYYLFMSFFSSTCMLVRDPNSAHEMLELKNYNLQQSYRTKRHYQLTLYIYPKTNLAQKSESIKPFQYNKQKVRHKRAGQ